MLQLSGRAGKADAQFVVRVDGEAIGGGTVTASRAAGESQTFAFAGRWGMGDHRVTVEAINLRGGMPAATELVVEKIGFGGNEYTPNRLLNGWRQSGDFAVAKTVEPAPPPAPDPIPASDPTWALEAMALAAFAPADAPASGADPATYAAVPARAAAGSDTPASAAASAGTAGRAQGLEFLAGMDADAGGAQAVRLYQAALGRVPDAGGLQFWSSRLQDGASLAELASGFLSSAEFQGRFGAPDDAGYVARLYQNVLGRPGEAGGTTFWTGTLVQGASREAVLVGFSESAENKQGTQSLFLPVVH